MGSSGENVIEPIVIWKSAMPRCFKSFKKLSRSHNVHHCTNPNAWMTTEIMSSVLAKINRKMECANRNIILFMDPPCHPESVVGK